jgi:hypothetical protein
MTIKDAAEQEAEHNRPICIRQTERGRDSKKQETEKITQRGLNNLYSPQNINRVLKSRTT